MNFKNFGHRELNIAANLLIALSNNKYQSKDDHIDRYSTELVFNENSGNVFLLDADLNVLMLNDDDLLENFLICEKCGEEGLRSEISFKDEVTCLECTK